SEVNLKRAAEKRDRRDDEETHPDDDLARRKRWFHGRDSNRTARRRLWPSLVSRLRDRSPILQPLSDQLGTLPVVTSVQYPHVVWIGAQVNTGGPRIDFRVRVRMRREVPGCAIGGLNPELPRPVQLRRVRVQGPFSLPIVKDAGRVLLLLRRFAPVPGREGAILLPGTADDLERAIAVSRDP